MIDTEPSCNRCVHWVGKDYEGDAFLVDEHSPAQEWPRDMDRDAEDAVWTDKPNPTWGQCFRVKELDAPMFPVDGSDYFAALMTRASFRCSAFTPRSLT